MKECERLNVVFIGPVAFPSGGAMSKRRRYLIDYLNSRGIHSHFLVSCFKKINNDMNDSKGVYGLCDYCNISHIAARKGLLRSWATGRRILRQWYKEGCDNIILFDVPLMWYDYPFFRFASRLGYKIFFDHVETTFNDDNQHKSLLRRINIALSEWITGKVCGPYPAFVISTALWNELSEAYPQKKLCLLPNSTPIFKRDDKTALGNPLKLLYAGSFADKDGVKYLMDGVIKANSTGCRCILSLYGAGSTDDMKVLELAEGRDYIKYHGFVSDDELVAAMTCNDILCMTRCNSRFANYGFPFKLSEYLASGGVVLATDVGDVCKYVENRKSAYIIPPEDSDAIADAIIHISRHPNEALLVARNGVDVARQHFSIENSGGIFESFISGALQ